MALELTEAQKQIIRDNFRKNPDLRVLTQLVWDEEDIDGRSKKGRLVREFLITEGLEYSTTKVPPVEQIELTANQKEFLMGPHVEAGMKPLEIARLVFEDPDIVSLSIQHRIVQEFLKEYRPEVVNTDDIETTDEWHMPTTLFQTIKRVNKWTGQNFEESKMSMRHKKGCEALLNNMRGVRLSTTINAYSLESDRDLFESEFVKATWDKPDLTVDEVNLYITVCSNYVRTKHTQRRLDSINRFVQNSTEPDVSMRVTDQLKATSEELNHIEKRIESLINKLNGDRAKRLSEQGSQNVSILSLVEAWQEYEERERMVKRAEMENDLVSKEVERLESMEEMKARILGISKYEIL